MSGPPEQKKKPLFANLLAHGKQILQMALYFFCCLAAAETFHCATLLETRHENRFLTSYAAAGITALILGKCVFLLDRVHLTKIFDHKPLAIVVLYKTVIFTAFTNVILTVHHFIRHHSFGVDSDGDSFKFIVLFATHQLILVIAFALFFSVRELDQSLGGGIIAKHFFGNRQSNNTAPIELNNTADGSNSVHAPTTTTKS